MADWVPPKRPTSVNKEKELSEEADNQIGTLPAIDEKHGGLEKGLTSLDGDPEFIGLTITERKMVLINRALNSMGMRRYQWCIFFLCGLGYLVDLAFAKLFGLILSPLVSELGISTVDRGNLSSCFSAGLCGGAFMWGILVDIIGRKWAFNISLFITAAFGLCLGAPDSYTAICVLAAFCGIGLGGNIPVDATICLEFLPAQQRWLIVVLSVFQPLGVFLCSLISWGLIPSRTCELTLPSCYDVAEGVACCAKADNMGWRYASFTIGGLCLALFIARFVVFNFKETPKFLVMKGRDQEAIDVVQYVAKFNKLPPIDLDITHFQQIEIMASQTSTSTSSTAPLTQVQVKKWFDLSHMKVLFSSRKVGALTILIFAIYMIDYWAFSMAGTFLPTILREKGAARAVSTQETYRNYIIQALCGIPGVLFGAACTEIRIFGQKWALAVTGAAMGVCLCLYAVINSQDANVAFNSLTYCFQSAFNAVLYGCAPLYLPTAVRGSGIGTASALGRMISIVSPLIGARILAGTNGLNDILFVAGCPMFGAALLCLLLPNIRKGHVY